MPRLIPILQIQDSSAVKTTGFGGARYIGSALNSIRMFSEIEVDELVVIDLSDPNHRQSIQHMQFLEEFCSEGFMPLSYGGRVSSVEEAVRLARLGFEKVIVGTSSYLNTALMRSIADQLGAQAVVAAVDVRLYSTDYRIFSHSGTQLVPFTLEQRMAELATQPIGEILLTNIDREGRRVGIDLELVQKVADLTEVPLVIAGGTATISDCVSALQAGASAVAIGDTAVRLDGPTGTLVHLPPNADQVRSA